MRALITGITGTLGTAVCTKLLRNAKHEEIIGFSRDEFKQTKLPKDPKLTLYLGDVRDSDRLEEASRGVDIIYHFAALKHVDKLEENPEEAVQTNVIGTINVLHAQRMNGIDRVVLSSTDKAAYPVNTYGCSKRIAERLVRRNQNNIVCRYGNVLASRGSCVESFVSSLKKSNRVDLTDPNMTRFWISIDEASDFVISSSELGSGGLCVPIMKAAPISLVAEVIASIMGIKSYTTNEMGHRSGEKLHECLRTEYEGEEIHSNRVAQFTREELTALLTPIVKELQ